MRRVTTLLLLTFLALVAQPTCASDLEGRAQAAAAVIRAPFQLFEVPSDGPIADTTFIATSKARGPSGMAKQLAKVLRDAEDDSKSIAVTGPSDAKTAQVLADAITLLKGKRLEHTSIIFVGSKTTASDLEPKVVSTGATFLFAEF